MVQREHQIAQNDAFGAVTGWRAQFVLQYTSASEFLFFSLLSSVVRNELNGVAMRSKSGLIRLELSFLQVSGLVEKKCSFVVSLVRSSFSCVCF